MAGQFDKESSVKHFEWHRERALRDKDNSNPISENRKDFLIRSVAKKHGEKAARELIRELRSK